MKKQLVVALGGLVVMLCWGAGSAAAQSGSRSKSWTPPRTSWGDPDLQGTFTNRNEQGIPLERPYEYYGAKNSRAWLIVDPSDGRVPPLTDDARKRTASRAEALQQHGESDSYEDRSLYDRCITRGIPASMMPGIYGMAYQFVQSPGYVAIRYEMIHETRIIPLDGRSHLGSGLRSYLGDGRGHWDGDTLVVETTNFNGKVGADNGYPSPEQGSTAKLRLVERFKPVGPGTIEWSVTLDDPSTWSRPWTYAMNLTKDDGQVFEYACHEGNYGLMNILSAARALER
jgi:hypothetical protein